MLETPTAPTSPQLLLESPRRRRHLHHHDQLCSPLTNPKLGSNIRSSSNLHRPTLIETLPAGYFSKSTSFSKIQRPYLNFESAENDTAPPVSADWAPRENKPNNVIKKHPNLIGANAPLPAVKLRKCSGSEGNFVKLNLNYGKRKFLNRKGKKKSSYASSSRGFYRRSKQKLKREGDVEMESVCDEEGLVTEIGQQQPKKGCELIEKAVLEVRNEALDENLMRLLNVMYGFDSFREGQLEAIKMVLDGKSTMLVLPTGAGKSLCYQIPAMVFAGVTLVVSPLVALMIDQLKQLPLVIQGGLLCSSQVFLVLSSVHPKKLVRHSGCCKKGDKGEISDSLKCNAFTHHHYLEFNRMKDLLTLIKSSPYKEVQSIIIYCKFQSYHSSMPSKDRSRIQESFCSNKIRVVVATVAFGMGLDKRDVGAVIHYSLPESLEEYVQVVPTLVARRGVLYVTVYSSLKQILHLFRRLDVLGEMEDCPIAISFLMISPISSFGLKGEITYEVKDPAYCYSIVEVPGDFCSLSRILTEWLLEVERCKVQKLDAMFNAAVFAVNECEKMQGCHGAQHTPCLQRKILDYFKDGGRHDIPNKMGQSSPFLRADIKDSCLDFFIKGKYAAHYPLIAGEVVSFQIAGGLVGSLDYKKAYILEPVYVRHDLRNQIAMRTCKRERIVQKLTRVMLVTAEHDHAIFYPYKYRERRWDLKQLVGSGGMPSSHSATVTALAMAVGLQEGFGGSLFAIALILACVVMYDATGVRLQAGRQAEVLNQIVYELPAEHPLAESRPLRELLGHTPPQVIAGGLLGLVTGVIGYLITILTTSRS
ncbi:unnamed protein product [Dovyalis caffra]|uniref:DNA 3'-5' helicase n=1 Tax=Dovyalis caffra TaxID=77055 RepID=A0AAV1R308_9ROSI|nr:unnamed protein product [Dovyalis caffra]